MWPMGRPGRESYSTRALKRAASSLVTAVFGASCAHRRSNREGLETELDTCEGRRPSEGGAGDFLRQAAVTPAVRDGYRRLITGFLLYCWCLQLPLATQRQIDEALCKYADEQFCDGIGASVGERLLSAWCNEFPEHVPGQFPLYLRALRGWRRMRPKFSRHPLPWPFAVTCAYHILTQTEGGLAGCVALLLLFDAYLRPYELFGLRRCDVVRPVPAQPYYCLIVCPRDALKPSKTHTYDDSVVLDTPDRTLLLPVLEHFLMTCAGPPHSTEPLFNFTHSDLLRWFKVGMTWLSLDPWAFSLYSCRHGGPSEDFSRRVRDLNCIQRRGRWACDQSVRRYQQTGRLHVVYARAPPSVLSLCLQVTSHFDVLFRDQPTLLRPVVGSYSVPDSQPLDETAAD